MSMSGARPRAVARRTRMGELRDLILYVLIGIGVLLVLWALTEFTRIDDDSLSKWLGLGFVTPCVLGEGIRANRRHWKNRRFWLLLALFFIVQTAAAIPVFLTVARFKAIYWGLFFVIDCGLLAAYLAYFLDRRD